MNIYLFIYLLIFGIVRYTYLSIAKKKEKKKSAMAYLSLHVYRTKPYKDRSTERQSY